MSEKRIVIVETGGANLASVQNAIARLGLSSEISHDEAVIRRASHVILPGVGAARAAMDRLNRYSLGTTLRELRQPVLGICLGMQLLFDGSEEGAVECLGILEGRVSAFDDKLGLAVPHMGWNRVSYRGTEACALFEGVADGSHFYFVHSFIAPRCGNLVAESDYGGWFPAAVAKQNFFGVQFHPERSGEAGARLLRNFFEL